MSLPDCIDVTLCVRLVQTLGHSLWQGVFVFLLLWLATSLMRSCSPHARYTVSVFALLLIVVCPAVTFMLIGQEGREDTVPTVLLSESPSAPVISKSNSESLSTPAAEPPAIAKMQAPFVDWRQYAPHAVVGYLAGVVVMLGRLLLALQGGRRLCRRSEPVDDPRLLVALVRQAKVLGISFTPVIGYCRQIVVPTVIGVVRPMILLPISFSTGLSTEQIEVLLAHELAHIRRYDHLVNILQRIMEAVLFFHPCVWLISRRIRIEREHCCDDLVLAGGVEDTTYADSLIQMAEIVLASRSGHPLAAAAALGAADRSSLLWHRILRVIENPAQKPIRLVSGTNFTLILMGFATTLAVFQLAASGRLEDAGPLSSKSIIDGNAYILGYVKQPGAYEISEGKNLTLVQLITAAGGYDGNEIDHASVMLSRYGTDGKRHVVREIGLKTLLENKKYDILLHNGDIITLSNEPLYRPQYGVRLVVGNDRMTFQGHDTTWDHLPTLLQAIPKRAYTVIFVSMAEDNVPTAELFSTTLRKTDEIVNEYGFQERVLKDAKPLGYKDDYLLYIPVESMHYAFYSKEIVSVDENLLQTHTSDPPGQPRHAVRLVVGADRMTFQGQDVNWQQLPDILNTVPNRDHTVFEIAVASDSPPGDKFYEAEAKVDKLQKQFGFKRLAHFGLQPLGSIGMLTRYVVNEERNRASQHTVHISIGKGELTFEGKSTSWSELPSLLEQVPDRRNTSIQLNILSHNLPATTFMNAHNRIKQMADQFGFAQFSNADVSP